MYHYQKNIGDYRSATMHLSLLEHGVYNQLLDWYYLDEQPIPLDNRTLFRRLSARTEVEQQAVLDVLSEMFKQTDAGWIHKRVEREIAQYKAKSNQAREAGKLGGRPPKKGVGSVDNRDGFEDKANAKPTANREPLTINQEPLVNAADAAPTTPKRGKRLADDWQLPKLWGEWALAEYPAWTADIVRLEAAKFADHWHAQAGKDAVKLEWEATWRTWCRSDICQRTHGLKPTYAQQAADVARTTVPSRPDRDPVLVQIEADAAKAAPIPDAVRALANRLKVVA